MRPVNPPNQEIADVLERLAELLEAQDGNPFRIRAYRRAARVVERLEQSVALIADLKEGKELEALPGIGKSIAGTIREFVHTGRLGLLERLEGQISPEDLFTTIPGIGEQLAHRIHLELQADTLEDLELAAHDGRLEQVHGMGERRTRGVRESLESMLTRSSRRRARRLRRMERGNNTVDDPETLPHPPIGDILDVDDEYRRKAKAGGLKSIVPRRFNPGGKLSLPIFHTDRKGWHMTALFSNTARAHDLGKTRDWVVVYYDRDGHENQCTVVTEHRGPLRGKRVVRGHERECLTLYGEKA